MLLVGIVSPNFGIIWKNPYIKKLHGSWNPIPLSPANLWRNIMIPLINYTFYCDIPCITFSMTIPMLQSYLWDKSYGFLKFPFYWMGSFKYIRKLPFDSLIIIFLKTKFWVDIWILLSNIFPMTTFFLNSEHWGQCYSQLNIANLPFCARFSWGQIISNTNLFHLQR